LFKCMSNSDKQTSESATTGSSNGLTNVLRIVVNKRLLVRFVGANMWFTKPVSNGNFFLSTKCILSYTSVKNAWTALCIHILKTS